MLKYILYSTFLLCISCQNSSEISFHDLSNAFIDWYYKFHPVETSRKDIHKYHNKFQMYGISENEEYIADLSRFIIELSQIDLTKLSEEISIDYKMLLFNLEKKKFNMHFIRMWEWNPLIVLNEILNGLMLVTEKSEFDMADKVYVIKERLELIPQILVNSEKLLIYYSPIHFETAIAKANKILEYLNDLPLKLNSDNSTLDHIDKLIKQSKIQLIKYSEKLNKKDNYNSEINFPSNLNLMNKEAFMINVGSKYLPNKVLQLAQKKQLKLQNQLFNITLPIYNTYNDEPVWLDYEDTLEVIHWTIDNIKNSYENQVLNSNVLNYFYDSIQNIEKFTISNQIVSKTNQKVKLFLCPKYFKDISITNLFNYQASSKTDEIIYFINDYAERGALFPLIKQEVDILNIKNIIPGFLVQVNGLLRNKSKIRQIFPDHINQYGWQNYSVQMLIEEGYRKEDKVYQILKLKEEIMLTCHAYVEGQYYLGKMNRKEAISYLKKHSFLDHYETELLLTYSDLELYYGIENFIGIMEMNSIRREYERKMDINFNLLDFHNFFLINGSIPANELKKKIKRL